MNHFYGTEGLKPQSRTRIVQSLRNNDVDSISSSDTCMVTGDGIENGPPYWHERQVRDLCAAHAANSFFGCSRISNSDIDMVKANRRGLQLSQGGCGLDFLEVQELLRTRGGVELKLLSFENTNQKGEAIRTALEWANVNSKMIKQLLGRPRFILCYPGHYITIHRGVMDKFTPFCMIDSCVNWQSIFSPVKLVEHLLVMESKRASSEGEGAFSSMFAVLESDVLLPISLPWITSIIYANSERIVDLLDGVSRRSTTSTVHDTLS